MLFKSNNKKTLIFADTNRKVHEHDRKIIYANKQFLSTSLYHKYGYFPKNKLLNIWW